MIGILVVLLIVEFATLIISHEKMCNVIINKKGKEWILHRGEIVGILMDYATLTKDDDGKTGIWFKMFVYSFVMLMLTMCATILHLKFWN